MSGALLQAASIGESIEIKDQTKTDASSAPADARIDYILRTNGNVDLDRLAGSDETLETWKEPRSLDSANYEVRATLAFGSPRSGSSATGTWLALSTERWWGVEETGIGSETIIFTLEIRRGTKVLSTATITLTAEAT